MKKTLSLDERLEQTSDSYRIHCDSENWYTEWEYCVKIDGRRLHIRYRAQDGSAYYIASISKCDGKHPEEGRVLCWSYAEFQEKIPRELLEALARKYFDGIIF